MATKFITVSIEIMHDKNLTPNQKFILAEIGQLSSLEKGCIASNKHFSELIGITPQGVSKAINSLAEKEYIAIDNAQTKRNFGRVITINSGKSAINSGKSAINSGLESKENITQNKTGERVTHANKKSGFNKPTLDEIKEYASFKKMSIDTEKFFDYFEAGNWIDSKGNKVKSWKQKLQTWNNYADSRSTKTTVISDNNLVVGNRKII